MAGPTPNWQIPNPTLADNMESELDSIRADNIATLVASALAANMLVPEWDLTAETHNADNLPLTREWSSSDATVQKCRLTYTYVLGRVNTVKFEWDYGGGSGYEDFEPSTATISYGSDHIISQVSWD